MAVAAQTLAMSSTPLEELRHPRTEANPEFAALPSTDLVASAVRALESNGFRVVVANSAEAAKRAVLDLVPEHAEVFDATSQTLTAIGVADELDQSGRYRAVRPEVWALRQAGKADESRRLAASPEYVVGSVHAVTGTGEVVIASASGSQLAPYAYGAAHVIWVVSTAKIVKDLGEAMRRVAEYSFPLENARAQKAYGRGSQISKLLIVNREPEPGRTTIVLVPEKLGF
jgi:L-lactate utilization protein LutC